jgi:hypothetical protein
MVGLSVTHDPEADLTLVFLQDVLTALVAMIISF